MPNFPEMDMKDASTANSRVYVGGLSEEMDSDCLYEVFKDFGNILGIKVNRGYGFIQFELEESATEAIQKKHVRLNGRSLIIKGVMQNKSNSNTTGTEGNITATEEKEEERNLKDTTGDDRWSEEGVNRGGRRARGGRGRGGGANFRDRSPIPRGHYADPWDMDAGYDRYGRMQVAPNYRLADTIAERNDCEIIVVSRALTEYAEFIEDKLKRIGLVVDLLFPNENVPIGRVLGNISSRGCLYAILIMPQNYEHRSLTLNILHGLPQEHRNMPLEDAFDLITHNWREYQTTGRAAGRPALMALLKQLAAGHTLTVLQYDTILHHVKECREKQVKIELGESAIDNTNKATVDLQQRIMSILNSEANTTKDSPTPVPAPAPAPVAPPVITNPSVQKALDALLSKII